MSVILSPLAGAGFQFFDNDGLPLSGGFLYSYAAGTSTPQTTYTDYTGNIAHSNPIQLNSAGRIPNELWITANLSYKFVLRDSANNLIWTQDNISGPNPSNFFYNQGSTGAVTRTLQARLQDYVSVKDFGAVGNGIADDTAAIQNALNASALVYMEPGTYKTSANISLNNGNSLIGVPGETIIAPINYGGGYNLEIFDITTAAKVYGITIDANFYAYPVNVYNSANVTIENCTFSNGGQDCIYIGESSNLVIRNCRINDATRNGISVISGTNIIIDGCWIVGTDTAHTGGSPWSGIDVEPDPGVNVDGIVISNCRIYDWAGHGCAFAGINSATQYVRNARFIGNYVENAGFDCVAALGAGCEVTIDGNTIRTGSRGFFSNNVGTTPARAIFSNNIIRPKTGVTTALGIECQVDTQLTATGNAIYGMAEPVKLASCISGCTFTGNLISDCTSPFTVFSSSNVNIVGNQFKSSYGIDIITGNGVLVNGNKFSDMNAAATTCVDVRLTSAKVSIVGNEFSGTGAGLTKFVAQSASTNVHVSENMGVVLGGISQFLQTGSWTPTYQTSNADIGTVTYDAITGGAWSRVGNIVTITGTIRTDNITSVGTGELQIHGLPYNVATSATDSYVGSIAVAYSSDFAGDAPLGGYIPENTKYVALTYKTSVNGSSVVSQAADLDTGANKNLVTFAATYITADDV